MSKIKTKPKGTIKELDKKVVQAQKFKNNVITVKEKANELSINENNSTAEDYASKKVQNDMNYVSRRGIVEANEIGKKSVSETRQNLIKGKQKVKDLKLKFSENSIKSNSNKLVKKEIKQNVSSTKHLAKKEIKTADTITKINTKVAKENVNTMQKLARKTKEYTYKMLDNTKKSVKAIKQTFKNITKGTKAIFAFLIAGGWIAIIIILIIAIIGGFVAVIYDSDGSEDYDSSQISSSEIVLVAKAQVGNVGGEIYWSWYGFSERVEWCACFVSWCADQCRIYR